MNLLKLFKKPTYREAVFTNLEQARHSLLEAEATLELAQARVAMYRASITRLEKTANNFPYAGEDA